LHYHTDPPTLSLLLRNSELGGSRMLRAIPAAMKLLARSLIPDRASVMTQTKWDRLVLHYEGWARNR
jgi:hypothetical protein